MATQGFHLILKNSAYLAGARFVTSALRVVYAIALAKYLGAEFYGMFNLAMSWYLLFLPISVLGLDSILIREVGRNKQDSTTLIGQTLAVRSAASVLVASACFLIGYFLENNETAKTLILIFSVTLLVRGLSVWLKAVFTALERADYIFRQETSFRILEVIFGLTIIWLGGGVIEVASIHLTSWLLQSIYGFYFIRTNLIHLSPIWDWHSIKKLILQGIPFVIAAIFGTWLIQGGLFIVRIHDGYNKDLGMYALALQALVIIGGIVAEVGKASLPALSRSVDRGDNKIQHFMDVVFRTGIIMGGLLAIGGLTIGRELIELILGASYLPVTQLLPWTLFLVSGFYLIALFNSVITSFGNYYKLTKIAFFGSTVFTILAIPLYQYFGLIGIVLATGIGMLTSISTQVSIIKKVHRINFTSSVAMPLIAIITGLFVANIDTIENAWLHLSISLLALFVATLLLKVITPSEINHLKKLITG